MASLGKYQLVAEIARGGMGIVYLAVTHGPARFSKLLVVKELKPELVDDPTFLEMFLEEARLAARLNHPNIVQTYEIGAEGQRHYMVMDYLEGVTLARVLRKKSDRFTVPMQLRIIADALQGLEYAHTLSDFDGTPLGIVHRDATPQNVFITFDGQVKLVDFGIAKALDSTVETRTGVLKGKPAYMAPEQISGDVDPRADVFAAGVMIWEAVAGRRMWHKKGDVEVLTHIIKGEIPTLRETVPNAPEALLAICDRALAKDKDERYPSAAALQADLEQYLSDTHSNVSTRDVGKLVAELFETERTAVRSTIEKHLASLKDGAAADKPPSLHPPSMDTVTPSGARRDSLANSTRTPLSTGTPAGAELPARTSAAVEIIHPAHAQPEDKRRRMFLVAAIIVAILGVGTIAALSGTRATTPSAAASTAPTSPPVVTAPPEPAVVAATATATATASATASATPAAVVTAPPVTRAAAPVAQPRWTPPPRPAAPPSTPAPVVTAAPTPAPAASKVDCNPPFYFEGTKKVFKQGCL